MLLHSSVFQSHNHGLFVAISKDDDNTQRGTNQRKQATSGIENSARSLGDLGWRARIFSFSVPLDSWLKSIDQQTNEESKMGAALRKTGKDFGSRQAGGKKKKREPRFEFAYTFMNHETLFCCGPVLLVVVVGPTTKSRSDLLVLFDHNDEEVDEDSTTTTNEVIIIAMGSLLDALVPRSRLE